MPQTTDLILHLDAVAGALHARAAGLWRLEAGRLVLVHFRGAPDLPEPVAVGFTTATRSVAMTTQGLGIVQAARDGVAAVSIAEALEPSTGSGHWLRLFGAARSVAVPLRDAEGRLWGVASVAIPDQDEPPHPEVARRLQHQAPSVLGD